MPNIIYEHRHRAARLEVACAQHLRHYGQAEQGDMLTAAQTANIDGPPVWDADRDTSERSASIARTSKLLAATIAGLALVATPVASQTRDEAAGKLDEKRSTLNRTVDRATSLATDVAAINKARERINARLLETAALIQKSEGRLTEIEARLSELEAQEKIVRGSLMQRYGEISKLLGVLQRMGRNPPPVMITRREDALAMVRSAMLLAAAFPGMRTKALELAGKLEDLVRVLTEKRDESERLRAEAQRLNDAQVRLAGLMSEKKRSLADRQSELAKVREEVAEISRDVKDLNELIDKIDRNDKRSEDQRRHNEKAAEEIRLAEARAAAAKTAEAANGTGVGPVTGTAALDATRVPGASDPASGDAARRTLPAEGETQVAVLAPVEGAFARPNAGRIEPAVPFHLAKGRLPYPTPGKRVMAFAQATSYGPPSKGVVFETRHAAQITSPCDGWIVYAGEFRSYGQLLIINAGGGYHVLLAGLNRIDVQPGQFVLAAEPVGTMSDAAATLGRGPAQGQPVLYVEFRKDGRPVNPDPWWATGAQKVQG
ncbi:MAG: peptidoglycan DD-metalloendopeptidase family protein [Hyphomicrobiaceae bacterium]|nr:peptidoglycan DD-metalloendopeptidase family protein [Hyphomicrobiaceae bacterium]